MLEETKADRRLERIPVVMLTTSHAERDILNSFDPPGNCSIRKPGELAGFLPAVRIIEEFWLTLVTLPH